MSWPRFRFWLIEAAAWWLQAEPQDLGEWLPFVALVLATFAAEAILALWIMGAIRPL